MLSTFDVPGSVILRDVSRPAPGETPADRLRRLAAVAVVEGCLATRRDDAEMVYAVTSGSRSGVTYGSRRHVRPGDHITAGETCDGRAGAGIGASALVAIVAGLLAALDVTPPSDDAKVAD